MAANVPGGMMKNLQIIKFEGLRFQFVEDCGLQLLENNNECTGVESSEETKIRHHLIDLLANGEDIEEIAELEYMGE